MIMENRVNMNRSFLSGLLTLTRYDEDRIKVARAHVCVRACVRVLIKHDLPVAGVETFTVRLSLFIHTHSRTE